MISKQEYDKVYREVNKEKISKYQKEYRKKNRERLLAYKKQWNELNQDKIKLNSKKRYIENNEAIKAYTLEYKKMYPEKANANKATRRSAKKLRTPKWLTNIDFERIENEYKLASLLTKLTGDSWHVDHIVPLQGKTVSGLHVPYNLQVLRASENCSKQNHYIG
jgi:5-methylcytosine-specific restriction endonuclease McrA